MIRNFLFHRVDPQRDALWDPMDPLLFERCIRYISGKYKVALLEELVQDGKAKNSKKQFATISFDDGYKDNIRFAAPILDKYKLKASFYVVTDCIEKNIPTWTYILDHAFQSTQKKEIDLFVDFLPPGLQIKELPDKRARMEYVKRLKPAMKKISHPERVKLLALV